MSENIRLLNAVSAISQPNEFRRFAAFEPFEDHDFDAALFTTRYNRKTFDKTRNVAELRIAHRTNKNGS